MYNALFDTTYIECTDTCCSGAKLAADIVDGQGGVQESDVAHRLALAAEGLAGALRAVEPGEARGTSFRDQTTLEHTKKRLKQS